MKSNVNDIPSAKQNPLFSFLKTITTRLFIDKKNRWRPWVDLDVSHDAHVFHIFLPIFCKRDDFN